MMRAPLPVALPLLFLLMPWLVHAGGEREFHDAVTSSPWLRLSDEANRALEPAARHYRAAAQVEAGRPGFHTRHGDEAVREAREALLQDAITFDFRSGSGAMDDRVVDVSYRRADILVRVLTGESEDPSFRVQEADLGESAALWPDKVRVARNGETWILLGLDNVVSGLHTHQLDFVADSGEQELTGVFRLNAEEPGGLVLEIMDEAGSPVPTLIRLENEAGGYWMPPGAIDLRDIMLDVIEERFAGPETAYPYNVPSALAGPFWLVPSGFETRLPAGSWTVSLWRGIERESWQQTIEIVPGETVRKSATPRRILNPQAEGWYSADDHVHARLLSGEDAWKLLTWAEATGVNILNILEMGDQNRTWYQQRGFGPDYRVHRGDHILIPGQEDPRFLFGHVVGLNIRSLVRDLDYYTQNDRIADEIHQQGGLVGQAHLSERGHGTKYGMAMFLPTGKLDFATIMQRGLGTERYYDFLNLGFRITASAGGDAPYDSGVGESRVYAWTGVTGETDPDAFYAAMKKGRTFVTNGPLIEFKVEDVFMPGDEIPVTGETPPLRVRATARGIPESSSPRRIVLVYNGEEIALAEEPDASAGELTLTHELAPEFGGWLAVRVDGHNGSQAHTTPVYVTREGFRHWNTEQAPAVIAEQLGLIEEVETEVRRQVGRRDSGEISPLDSWNTLLANQSEEILARAARSREFYTYLLGVLEAELSLRN